MQALENWSESERLTLLWVTLLVVCVVVISIAINVYHGVNTSLKLDRGFWTEWCVKCKQTHSFYSYCAECGKRQEVGEHN